MANFEFFNITPIGENDEENCVNRAIALATNTDYYFVYYLLYSNSLKNGCERITKSCYRKILENRFKLIPQNGNGKMVCQIADKYPNNCIIMRLSGHLTTSIYSTIFDTFDTRDLIVDEFWLV